MIKIEVLIWCQAGNLTFVFISLTFTSNAWIEFVIHTLMGATMTTLMLSSELYSQMCLMFYWAEE